MNRKIRILISIVLASSVSAYYLFRAGYLETPSEDYLGNILVFAQTILSWDYSHFPNKLLPVYPFVLSALSKFFSGRDPVLTASLVLNYILIIPYFIAAYAVYSRFLSKKMTVAALFFLFINTYTLYTVLNPELEIFLATMTLVCFAMMARGSSLDIFFAMITSATKWDSVFIVPAVAWKRFYPGFRFAPAFVAGAVSSLLFVIWCGYIFLSRLGTKGAGNTYVTEIIDRGPNIYRFLADAFLVPSGFVQWAGLDVYKSGFTFYSAVIALASVLFGLFFFWMIISGLVRFARTDHPLRIPVGIYAGGFFLIHMIYQNTKDKYVLPIVWFVVLLAFIGLERHVIPLLKRWYTEKKGFRCTALFVPLFLCAVSFAVVFRTHDAGIWLFLPLVSAAWFVWLFFSGSVRGPAFLAVFTFSVFVIGMNFSYGKTILDHYSLRRVEFKIAGEWLRDNDPGVYNVLASEGSVIQYYSGIPWKRIFITMDDCKKVKTIEDLESVMVKLDIKYLYLDDFYIRRIITGDKNAIDRKAPLLKKLREQIDSMKGYTLVKKVHVYPDINGALYRIDRTKLSGAKIKNRK